MRRSDARDKDVVLGAAGCAVMAAWFAAARSAARFDQATSHLATPE
ncbi:MAG TPA: hypothetical protein VF516_07305 [Kofleriaceae bacterium]